MGFLAPWFLAGAALLGLPVWLHLLRRHRSEPLPFASLRFFERRTQSSVKHRRLQYLVLFALRTALVLLLVLAFANPFVRRHAGAAAGGRRLVVLAIDDSFSMRQGGRLEQARRDAAAEARKLRPGDRAQVVAFDSSVRTMSDATTDRAALDGAIAAVRAGDSRGSYAELTRALRSMARTARVPVEAHVFSDMQKSSLPPNFADLAAEEVRIVPHPAAAARTANATVESVRAPGRVYDNRKTPVEATVAAYGAGGTRRAALLLNGREIESHSVELAEGGRARVEFSGFEAPYGMNRGEVRLEPADAFPDDDRFYFAVERADPRPALFVHAAGSSRGLLYFRAALDAGARAAFLVEPVVAEQAAHVNPAKYGLVVLSDAGELPAQFEKALGEYVRGGGAVWVALGRAAAARGRVPVSGDRIGEPRYFGREGDRFQAASWIDPAHPIVAGTGRWDEVKFYQVVPVEAGGARVVARLSDGSPLVTERSIGEGRVVVFASTFDNVANDFPLHPAFVPFVEHTARYLARLEDAHAGYAVDAYLDLREAKAQGGAAAEVLGPDGKRVLSLEEAAKARTLQLARAGFYDIKRPNGRREVVAVNTDRRESDLDVIPAETLALWSGKRAPGTPGAGGGAAEDEKPSELWWYVMLAALAVAVAESWIGNRHLAVEREPEAEVRREAA